MDLDRIGLKDYWQAATLVETLIQRHRGRLPAVIDARRRGLSAKPDRDRSAQDELSDLQSEWERHVRSGATTAPAG